MTETSQQPDRIYHLAAESDWKDALEHGSYPGTPQDRADGFIHFSTAAQVAVSAAKHRAGRADIVLVEASAAKLGDSLRWEPSRGGQLFPHLYGPLPISAVTRTWPLPLGDDGLHRFPTEVGATDGEGETH
ncbi:MAG: glutathione S-transferase [Rhodospirillaceae bacterium]|nr:glutathione S-transferase [Rhodospirillaceae bacterium]